MKPRFLWWVVLLLVQFGRPKHVEVGVEIGGTGHTFTAHVNELSGDTRARALEWCAAMNVDDPRCASFIFDRVKFLQGLEDNAQQQIQSIYAHIGAGLSVDSALVGQLRQLSEVLAGRGGDLEADANYLLSVSLRRLRPKKFGCAGKYGRRLPHLESLQLEADATQVIWVGTRGCHGPLTQ